MGAGVCLLDCRMGVFAFSKKVIFELRMGQTGNDRSHYRGNQRVFTEFYFGLMPQAIKGESKKKKEIISFVDIFPMLNSTFFAIPMEKFLSGLRIKNN